MMCQVVRAEEIIKARDREKYSSGSQPGWNELVLTFWLPLGLYLKLDGEAAEEIGVVQNSKVTKVSRRNVTTARRSMELYSARYPS